MADKKRVVAIGPRMVGFGSWDWVGGDLVEGLAGNDDPIVFNAAVPKCDIAVFIKFKPSTEVLAELSQRAKLIYCPIDYYGSCGEIDEDRASLQLFDRIVVHAPRLARYFGSTASAEAVDHAIKFAAPLRTEYQPDGSILWVGVRSSLPPLVSWLRKIRLPAPLVVLTNPEDPARVPSPDEFGFPSGMDVSIDVWSAKRQIEATAAARATFDVKGDDFRARHKPPAKALDYIASGVPFAVNADSATAIDLQRLGFQVADPTDLGRWLSREYWEETIRFAGLVRPQLTREHVSSTWNSIINDVLSELPKRYPTRIVAAAPARKTTPLELGSAGDSPSVQSGRPRHRTRVAILSLLFNWPSTGGGTIHTTETAKFLSRAGYDVRHFSAEFPEWELGMVREPPPYPVESIWFRPDEWNAETIQRRFREEVDKFAPDAVIITDSWNFKPHLAEAMDGYPYFLRLAAQECICPLNNIRLLIDESGAIAACPRNQLADPAACRDCVSRHQHHSGSLHNAERQLSGFENEEYARRLQQAFRNAAGVLVVNPEFQALVEPYAESVHVIPSGFDPARFPKPEPHDDREDKPVSILFAGVRTEFIKGFHVLQAAAEQLWAERQDFEIVVTSKPPEACEPFARYIGWQSQHDLPKVMRDSDIVVVPTVVEEALGRTAVEAMGAGRPVVASNIGGLPYTVEDGVTGLLFKPSKPADLAEKLRSLLDNGELRDRLGTAGRDVFESKFQWPSIVDRQYRPLLGPVERPVDEMANAPAAGAEVRLGCILAVRDRAPEVLRRTLETYTYQSLKPIDCVLLDYGSRDDYAQFFRQLAAEFNWRYERVEADSWNLSDACNRAVAALDDCCEIVFKNDVDVMLEETVLATAADCGSP